LLLHHSSIFAETFLYQNVSWFFSQLLRESVPGIPISKRPPSTELIPLNGLRGPSAPLRTAPVEAGAQAEACPTTPATLVAGKTISVA
jgi:hypothetical protein